MVYRRIRDLREDSDLKQVALAKYLNCTQVCYSQYELGKRDIPTEVLIKLADYYGISIDYLLGRTDVKTLCPEEGGNMFKNKNPDGTRNLCGKNVARLRMAMQPKVSQNNLAGLLQLAGLDLEKNAVQRIESGQRFVTDIELKKLAEVLGVSINELIR